MAIRPLPNGAKTESEPIHDVNLTTLLSQHFHIMYCMSFRASRLWRSIMRHEFRIRRLQCSVQPDAASAITIRDPEGAQLQPAMAQGESEDGTAEPIELKMAAARFWQIAQPQCQHLRETPLTPDCYHEKLFNPSREICRGLWSTSDWF